MSSLIDREFKKGMTKNFGKNTHFFFRVQNKIYITIYQENFPLKKNIEL